MLLLNLRSILATRRSPPAAFERAVQRHLRRAKPRFRARGAAIAAMGAEAAGTAGGGGSADDAGAAAEETAAAAATESSAGSALQLGRWLSQAPSAGFVLVLQRLLAAIEREL